LKKGAIVCFFLWRVSIFSDPNAVLSISTRLCSNWHKISPYTYHVRYGMILMVLKDSAMVVAAPVVELVLAL